MLAFYCVLKKQNKGKIKRNKQNPSPQFPNLSHPNPIQDTHLVRISRGGDCGHAQHGGDLTEFFPVPGHRLEHIGRLRGRELFPRDVAQLIEG